MDYLRQKQRIAEPGEVFNYNTSETGIVGNVVRSAIGNNLSTYLSEKIWKPFGMEHDAYWVLSEAGGGEFGGSSLNATLRDYARLGLFALREGELPNGSKALPEAWMAESITPSKGHSGYGYLWWLRDGGAYAASGVFGQAIQASDKVSVYLPKLNNTPYAQTRIRDLLQMASGVEWNENYEDPEADINVSPWNTLGAMDYLRQKQRVAEPGEVFNYNTSETGIVFHTERLPDFFRKIG